MSATIEVVCYKSKVLANNESPLMLQITKDRHRKYSSIGLSSSNLLGFRKAPAEMVLTKIAANKSPRNSTSEQVKTTETRTILSHRNTLKPCDM